MGDHAGAEHERAPAGTKSMTPAPGLRWRRDAAFGEWRRQEGGQSAWMRVLLAGPLPCGVEGDTFRAVARAGKVAQSYHGCFTENATLACSNRSAPLSSSTVAALRHRITHTRGGQLVAYSAAL